MFNNIIKFKKFRRISGCRAAKEKLFWIDITIPKITILGIVTAANTEKTAQDAKCAVGCLS